MENCSKVPIQHTKYSLGSLVLKTRLYNRNQNLFNCIRNIFYFNMGNLRAFNPKIDQCIKIFRLRAWLSKLRFSTIKLVCEEAEFRESKKVIRYWAPSLVCVLFRLAFRAVKHVDMNHALERGNKAFIPVCEQNWVATKKKGGYQ